MRAPKLVADALDVLVTVVLLLAAVGLLSVALGTGHVVLAWGSVVLSAGAAGMILRRWRRSWLQHQDELVLLPEDEPVDAESAEQPLHPASVSAQQEVDPVMASAESDAITGEAAPGEEDTDAADLLVVYELTEEVLVVDGHPRYHLARCRWSDHAGAERLPVREARELGFTPCGRCWPDTTLARRHRAARASTGGG